MPANEEGFRCSCFISYKHPPDYDDPLPGSHFYLDFVRALNNLLRYYLGVSLPPYFDEKLREKPGVAFPPDLACALCKSVCLVAVLTPEYLESEWCVAEWKAMEQLEKKRLGKDRKELIIPLLFQGSPVQMEKFADVRTVVKLPALYDPLKEMDGIEFRKLLKPVADVITSHAKEIKNTCEDCGQFRIEVGPEVPTTQYQDPTPI